MISFELDRDRIDPEEFVDSIARNAYSVTLAVSRGHTKTLIELPRSMTHSACADDASRPPDLVRMSIGLESPSDIVADLRAAMHACAKVCV